MWPLIQLTFIDDDRVDDEGDGEWTRTWSFVPRVGEFVLLEAPPSEDAWWEVTTVHWQTPGLHDPKAPHSGYAMATLGVKRQA